MGCKTSRISSTAEEIVTRKRQIKFSTTWWKKKSKRPKESDVKKDKRLFIRTLGDMSGNETPLYFRTEDSLLEVQSISSAECLADVRHGDSTRSSTSSLPREMPHQPVTTADMEDGLSQDDMEDDVSLTDYWYSSADPVPMTRTKSPQPVYKEPSVPAVLHNAWSDSSVINSHKGRPRHIFSFSRAKVPIPFRVHLEEPEEDDNEVVPIIRQRPKAAKGARQPPDLTEVYQAELCIPGTPMENPQQKFEKKCLNAWMERRMGDGAK